MKNFMKLELSAISENESFARNAVAAFALSLNPSLSELSDIKTAVSEAVTNCVVHAYSNAKKSEERIVITCIAEEENERKVLHIDIEDFGCGMESVEKAMQPFYTTLSFNERSGMGFTIMQTFMTEFSVRSELGKGTLVSMMKIIDEEARKDDA